MQLPVVLLFSPAPSGPVKTLRQRYLTGPWFTGGPVGENVPAKIPYCKHGILFKRRLLKRTIWAPLVQKESQLGRSQILQPFALSIKSHTWTKNGTFRQEATNLLVVNVDVKSTSDFAWPKKQVYISVSESLASCMIDFSLFQLLWDVWSSACTGTSFTAMHEDCWRPKLTQHFRVLQQSTTMRRKIVRKHHWLSHVLNAMQLAERSEHTTLTLTLKKHGKLPLQPIVEHNQTCHHSDTYNNNWE